MALSDTRSKCTHHTPQTNGTAASSTLNNLNNEINLSGRTRGLASSKCARKNARKKKDEGEGRKKGRRGRKQANVSCRVVDLEDV